MPYLLVPHTSPESMIAPSFCAHCDHSTPQLDAGRFDKLGCRSRASYHETLLMAVLLPQAVIGRWHDQATLEARGRFSAEIARLQKAHALHCDAIQAQHDAVCRQIRQHNEAVWPQVTIAQAAQEELDRVGRFIEHIRCGHAACVCADIYMHKLANSILGKLHALHGTVLYCIALKAAQKQVW